MSEPKLQHFVPKLSLKHFAGPDPRGHVWTYDAESGEVFSRIPEETAVQKHFYSAGNSDGSTNYAIEKMLSRIESKASPIYDNLVAGTFPSGEQERADFSAFLAVSYVRTPSMRRMSGEMLGRFMQITNYATGTHEGAFQSLVRRYEKETGQALSDGAKKRVRDDLVDPSSYRIEIPQQNTFHVFRVVNELAPVLHRMLWVLVEPKHGFFITGDNPLVRQVDPKTAHPFYGDHGFLNRTAEVTFPLSPQRMLMLIWGEGDTSRVGEQDAQLQLGRDFVDMMNRNRAIHAERYLYAHIRHKHIEELAREYKAHKPGMTTSGFGPERYAQVQVSRRRK